MNTYKLVIILQYIIMENFDSIEKNINDSYESEDLNLYKHLDEITDEAYKEDDGTAIPIILFLPSIYLYSQVII